MLRRTESVNSGRSRAGAVMLDIIGLAAVTQPHPNPRVGSAVVAPDGSIVARAAHQRAGTPHAEVLAIASAGDQTRGATLFVTLEPCDHQGRTPPCTESIIEAGISRVIIGAIDPDPRVAGAGVARLRAAGIDVETGVAAEEVEAMDPGYFHHRRTGRPLVTLKAAMTLDGQTAAADGTSQWITSEEARHDAHVLRSRSDAVMVGAGTLRADDPALTVRVDGYTGPQPRPVVVSGRAELPKGAQIWQRNPLIYGVDPQMALPSGEYVTGPGDDGADMTTVVKDLGSRGVVDLLVEGGARLSASLLRANIVDRFVVYVAAKLAGGTGRPLFEGVWATLTDAVDLEIIDVVPVGSDLRLTAEAAQGGVS